jgi:hypothetical protein
MLAREFYRWCHEADRFQVCVENRDFVEKKSTMAKNHFFPLLIFIKLNFESIENVLRVLGRKRTYLRQRSRTDWYYWGLSESVLADWYIFLVLQIELACFYLEQMVENTCKSDLSDSNLVDFRLRILSWQNRLINSSWRLDTFHFESRVVY